jgi:hypothetical protein
MCFFALAILSLTCLYQRSFLSRVTPRFLKWVTTSMSISFIMSGIESVGGECLRLKTIALVLAIENSRPRLVCPAFGFV